MKIGVKTIQNSGIINACIAIKLLRFQVALDGRARCPSHKNFKNLARQN
jgi:hypothetical protein